MAPVDVETVNERLNGLVTLLKAVGVDSFDDKAPDYSENGNGSKRTNSSIPDARQLDDEQIAAIIKKLQMAQSEAPQIIAALEAQAKMKRQQQQHDEQETQKDDDADDDDSYDDDANYPMVGPGCSDDVSVVSDLTTPTVVQNPHVSDEEHYRDTLPPMLIIGGNGTGTQQHPPMLIAPTKRKNLVGSVRANTLATAPRSNGGVGIKGPSGNNKGSSGVGSTTPTASSSKGAAAQRRKAYNATMERLTQDGGMPAPQTTSSPVSNNNVYPVSPDRSSGSRGYTTNQPTTAAPTSRRVKSSNNPQQLQQQLNPNDVFNSATTNPSDARKKVARRASLASGQVSAPRPSSTDDWHVPPGWDTFDPNPAPRMSASRPLKKSSTDPTTLIDDDGFLMSPTADFDPFAIAVNTPASKAAPSGRRPTDARSIGSGSRKSSGSDPKSESQHRRLKKPTSSSQPMTKMTSTSPTGGYKSSSNPHFVDQPQQRSRPQQQQSMGTMDNQYHQEMQQPKIRRSRRASLNM